MADLNLNHAGLLALSKRLKRPLYTLTVLAHDPFAAGAPGRVAAARWYVKLIKKIQDSRGNSSA